MDAYIGTLAGLAGPALAMMATWGLLKSTGIIRRRHPAMGWHCTARGISRTRDGRKKYEFTISGRTEDVIKMAARRHAVEQIEWNNRKRRRER